MESISILYQQWWVEPKPTKRGVLEIFAALLDEGGVRSEPLEEHWDDLHGETTAHHISVRPIMEMPWQEADFSDSEFPVVDINELSWYPEISAAEMDSLQFLASVQERPVQTGL